MNVRLSDGQIPEPQNIDTQGCSENVVDGGNSYQMTELPREFGDCLKI